MIGVDIRPDFVYGNTCIQQYVLEFQNKLTLSYKTTTLSHFCLKYSSRICWTWPKCPCTVPAVRTQLREMTCHSSYSAGPRANRSLVFEPDLRGASNKTLINSIKWKQKDLLLLFFSTLAYWCLVWGKSGQPKKREDLINRTSLEKSAAGHFYSSAAERVKGASVLFQHSWE